MVRFLLFLFMVLESAGAITLSSVLEQVIKNNPELEALRKELKSSKASLAAEKQLYLPEVFASYRLTYNPEKQRISIPAFGGLEFEGSKQSYHLFQGGLRYVLLDGGARFSAMEVADSNLRLKSLLYEERLQSVRLEATLAYLDTLSAKALLEAIKKQREVVELQLKTAQAFYERGLVAITDVLQARVRLAEVDRELRRAEGNYRLSLANLSRVSGLPEEELKELEEPEAEPSLKPLEHYLQSAKRRKILKAQMEVVEVFRSQKKLARSQFFPKVLLEASYAYSDQNPTIRPKATFGLSAGLTLNFQGIRPYYQEMSFAYLEAKAQKEYQDALEKVNLEVKKVYEELMTSKDNLKVSEEALSFAEKFFELSNRQYMNQLISQRELLEAEASLTKARMDRIVSYYQLLKSYYRLLFVSGQEL